MTITRGSIHEYLGMTIDFRMKGRCIFSQYDTIKKFWMSLPEDLRGPYKPMPAPDNLFKVDVNTEKLDEVCKE